MFHSAYHYIALLSFIMDGRPRGCQTRTHDIRSRKHKFNSAFVTSQLRKASGIYELSIYITPWTKQLTFVHDAQCWANGPVSLLKEKDFPIFHNQVYMIGARRSQHALVSLASPTYHFACITGSFFGRMSSRYSSIFGNCSASFERMPLSAEVLMLLLVLMSEGLNLRESSR